MKVVSSMADGTPMEVVSVVPDGSGAPVTGDEPLSEADAALLRGSCGACRLLGLSECEFNMALKQLQQRTGLGRVMAAQLLALAAELKKGGNTKNMDSKISCFCQSAKL